MKIETTLSDNTILKELGSRVAHFRLLKNLTQLEMSEEAGVSKRTIERLEAGSSVQLSSFIRVIRMLNLMSAFNGIVPEAQLGPIAQLGLQPKFRQRAAKKKEISKVEETPWTWGESES